MADAAEILKSLKGLKEDELNKLGPCVVCRKALLDPHAGGLTFYTVEVSRAAFDANAVRGQVGLAMVLGGSLALARVMGPDPDIAKVFDGPHRAAVHEGCADRIAHLLMLIPDTKEPE